MRHRDRRDTTVPDARPRAIGAVAFGAMAVGALAIGALAVGRLSVRSARVKRLEIGELVVRKPYACPTCGDVAPHGQDPANEHETATDGAARAGS